MMWAQVIVDKLPEQMRNGLVAVKHRFCTVTHLKVHQFSFVLQIPWQFDCVCKAIEDCPYHYSVSFVILPCES